MTTPIQADKTITNIRDIINIKRERSNHPATVKVRELLKLARSTGNPTKRQEHVEKALAHLPKVPAIDDVPDLAQKIKNEASKNLTPRNPNYARALKAVKLCDRIIAPEITDFMVRHAGSGPEGILFKKEIVEKSSPKLRGNASDNKEEPTTMDLMLRYAGM
ncbi:MAG: hypothetical protein WC861_05805 [Candidatus Micrarchaeia archaeon]